MTIYESFGSRGNPIFSFGNTHRTFNFLKKIIARSSSELSCDRYLNNRTSSLDYKPSEGETVLMQDCILNMSEWYKHVFANE